MVDAISNISGNQSIHKTLEPFVVHGSSQRQFGRLALSIALGVLPLQDGNGNGQALTSLELRGECEQLLVLGDELVTQLHEDENLWTPVLGVWRS